MRKMEGSCGFEVLVLHCDGRRIQGHMMLRKPWRAGENKGNLVINGNELYAGIAFGERFEFGKNWRKLLDLIDDDRITKSGRSLQKMLGMEELRGKHFLDIRLGGGLFSMPARRLGAQVQSFDVDAQLVASTLVLR